jgi:hypothetical protein
LKFRIHKVILSSGSKYFLEVFSSIKPEVYKEVEIPTLEIPLPVKTSQNSAGTC